MTLEDLTELVAHVDALARRDRHVDLARDFRERADVVRRHGLLDPPRPVRLELARDGDRLRRREAAVHLHEDLAVRADPFARGLHERDGAAELLVRQLLPGRAERIELDGAVPLREDGARGVADVARCAVDGVPAVRVCRDALADRPAEELVDG